MKCFFGHTWGLPVDRIQVCTKCGFAREIPKPHPCANGHLWEDTGSEKKINHYDFGVLVNFTVYIAQKCKVCGERRSVSKC